MSLLRESRGGETPVPGLEMELYHSGGERELSLSLLLETPQRLSLNSGSYQ